MKEHLQKIEQRIDSYSVRDRVVITGTLWIAIILIGWLPLLIDPISAKIDAAELQLQGISQSLRTLDAQSTVISARQGLDPNHENNMRVKFLKFDIKGLNEKLGAKTENLIPPKEMAKALRDLLKVDGGLRLIAAQSIAAQPIMHPNETGKNPEEVAPNTPMLYRHGLRIEFEADYLTGLEYLTSIESLPWAFYWERLAISTTKYPNNRFVLIVNTISFDKDWIGV